jgi:hypothetical protein
MVLIRNLCCPALRPLSCTQFYVFTSAVRHSRFVITSYRETKFRGRKERGMHVLPRFPDYSHTNSENLIPYRFLFS